MLQPQTPQYTPHTPPTPLSTPPISPNNHTNTPFLPLYHNAQRLVVLGREDLDALEAMVVEKFSAVKNLAIPPPVVTGAFV